jgi:hypothetical protein
LIESWQSSVHWAMSPGSRFNLVSFQESQVHVFVLFGPKFVISFIEPLLWRNIMRAIVSRSWIIVTQSFSVIEEINLLPYAYFFLFQLLPLRVFLFDRFFEAVCANSWHFPIFLFHLNFI